MLRMILSIPVALVWAMLAVLLLPFALIAAPFEIASRMSKRPATPPRMAAAAKVH